MGTWGTGPFDNDDAGDMVAAFVEPIRKVVHMKKAPCVYQYNAARCAVQFMMAAHGTDILGGPSAELALRALVRMRKDAGYLSSRKHALALNKEIGDVLDTMMRCKGCNRGLGKKGLRALYDLASDAINTETLEAFAKRWNEHITTLEEQKAIDQQTREMAADIVEAQDPKTLEEVKAFAQRWIETAAQESRNSEYLAGKREELRVALTNLVGVSGSISLSGDNSGGECRKFLDAVYAARRALGMPER